MYVSFCLLHEKIFSCCISLRYFPACFECYSHSALLFSLQEFMLSNSYNSGDPLTKSPCSAIACRGDLGFQGEPFGSKPPSHSFTSPCSNSLPRYSNPTLPSTPTPPLSLLIATLSKPFLVFACLTSHRTHAHHLSPDPIEQIWWYRTNLCTLLRITPSYLSPCSLLNKGPLTARSSAHP